LSSLQQAHKIYVKIRRDMDALDEKAKTDPNTKIQKGQESENPNAGKSYQFDDDDQLGIQLKIMVRKAILERSNEPLPAEEDDDAAAASPPSAPAPPK
jgi:hypothetical protein